ncbi:hypothetical protein ACVW16_000264 [Bradyrhizobium sp. USDA 4474]
MQASRAQIGTNPLADGAHSALLAPTPISSSRNRISAEDNQRAVPLVHIHVEHSAPYNDAMLQHTSTKSQRPSTPLLCSGSACASPDERCSPVLPASSVRVAPREGAARRCTSGSRGRRRCSEDHGRPRRGRLPCSLLLFPPFPRYPLHAANSIISTNIILICASSSTRSIEAGRLATSGSTHSAATTCS